MRHLTPLTNAQKVLLHDYGPLGRFLKTRFYGMPGKYHLDPVLARPSTFSSQQMVMDLNGRGGAFLFRVHPADQADNTKSFTFQVQQSTDNGQNWSTMASGDWVGGTVGPGEGFSVAFQPLAKTAGGQTRILIDPTNSPRIGITGV